MGLRDWSVHALATGGGDVGVGEGLARSRVARGIAPGRTKGDQTMKNCLRLFEVF